MTSALRLQDDPYFRRGMREMSSLAAGIGAWGLVTGVAMVKGGLSMPMAALMTLLVYAGSAQLAALPLLAAGAPLWVIWAAAFCVNLRFVIYSARWRAVFAPLPRWQRLVLGYLAVDLSLIGFQRAYPAEDHGPSPRPGQLPYFAGGALLLWAAWQVPSLIGIALAHAIPPEWGLGYAGTLAMVGLTYSLLSDRSTWVVAIVAGSAAVATYALPLKLNIIVAIVSAVAAGLLIEQVQHTARRLQSPTQDPTDPAR